MILWDLEKDEIKPGQWLNGPIRDFDVSLHGDHVIYFVSYHKQRAPYCWVAISKPPYFSALAMWPISDAWGGTCTFVDKSSIFIEKGMYQEQLTLSPDFLLKNYVTVDERHDWDWRMRRDGWRVCKPNDHPGGNGLYFLKWHKPIPETDWNLCLQNSRHPNPKPNYWLQGRSARLELPDTDCADISPCGRLVIAQRGRLCIANIDNVLQLNLTEVADFNDYRPEKISAPASSTQW